jgi:hypothetical protein
MTPYGYELALHAANDQSAAHVLSMTSIYAASEPHRLKPRIMLKRRLVFRRTASDVAQVSDMTSSRKRSSPVFETRTFFTWPLMHTCAVDGSPGDPHTNNRFRDAHLERRTSGHRALWRRGLRKTSAPQTTANATTMRECPERVPALGAAAFERRADTRCRLERRTLTTTVKRLNPLPTLGRRPGSCCQLELRIPTTGVIGQWQRHRLGVNRLRFGP